MEDRYHAFLLIGRGPRSIKDDNMDTIEKRTEASCAM